MVLFSRKNRRDPVCGRKVEPEHSIFSTVYNAHPFYFCSQKCFDRFMQESGHFARKARKAKPGIWSRYLVRVQKATDGKPPCCH